MHQVFISYARNQAGHLAGRIYDRFCNEGYSDHVFYDQEKMRSGKFPPQLHKAIEECTDFIVIVVGDSLSHEWVVDEVSLAIKNKKNIIPVIEDPAVRNQELPQSIKELWDYHELSADLTYFNSFMDELKKNLNSRLPEKRNTAEPVSRMSAKQRMEARLDVLTDKSINSYQYIKTILKHYVHRSIYYYIYGGSEYNRVPKRKATNLHEIRKELIHPHIFRNVLFTGPGGSGKSTALKWLFVNTDIAGCSSLYFNRNSIPEKANEPEELFDTLEWRIQQECKPCLVFIDGLDEFSCFRGKKGEFEKVVEFIDRMSSTNGQTRHKFIISTRSEHFGLNRQFRQNRSKKDLANYQVYEFLPLSAEESYRVCQSMKYLRQLNEKEAYLSFSEEWAEESDSRLLKLSEKEYLRALKAYLRQSDPEKSLLTSPLLCRYAYPIICEWKGSAEFRSATVSEQIHTVLKICIKWERCDEVKTAFENEEALVKYQNKVLTFLSEVAGLMKDGNTLQKSEWDRLRRKKRLTENAALISMEELSTSDGEYLAFSHQSFFDYFSARYYAEHRKDLTEEQKNHFKALVNENPSMCRMFVEQLAESDAEARSVCSWLINEYGARFRKVSAVNAEKPDPYGYVLHVFRGENIPCFSPKSNFSVETYFSVFPFGKMTVAGREMDADRFRTFCQNGILEIDRIGFLESIDLGKLASGNPIRGIVMHAKGVELNYQTFAFWINGKMISSFCILLPDERLLLSLIQKDRIREKIEAGVPLTQILSTDEEALEFCASYREESGKKAEEEMQLLVEWSVFAYRKLFIETSNLTGSWSVYSDGALYLLRVCKENLPILFDLFERLKQENIYNFVSAYGDYLASTAACCQLRGSMRFRETGDITIHFSESDSIDHEEETLRSAWSEYYSAVWKLARIAKESKAAKAKDLTQSAAKKPFILSLFEETMRSIESVEEFLEDNPDELLSLAISDERIVLFVMSGDWDAACDVSQSTKALCCSIGQQPEQDLRDHILSDDRTAAREFAEDFALKYVWFCDPEDDTSEPTADDCITDDE